MFEHTQSKILISVLSSSPGNRIAELNSEFSLYVIDHISWSINPTRIYQSSLHTFPDHPAYCLHMPDNLEISGTCVLLLMLGNHPILTLDKLVRPHSPQTTIVHTTNNEETGIGLENFVLELFLH